MPPLIAALLTLGVAALSPLQPARADTDVWKLMTAPGHVVLMRHAEAPGFGDPPGLRIGDCATQRNLDEAGRAQARRIGEALRARGIAFDRVLSSQWCRCRETAELATGRKPADLPALNSFFGDRSVAPERVQAITGYMRTLPKESRVLLVTHHVVIQALTGRNVRSGELVVVRLDDTGRPVLAGTAMAE